ncbi:PEGA domain-containing protein [Haloterrigena sp. H1]|uniref:carboxypeptidase regulatory-like domain-containing protein n=1 Tax=Haloterrigena sp. H1 TaxID=2552943 RepID=UPI00110F3251|nr:carboxypeptidase regulatory-like domain-containing protein [Haloterrigena sp. H1]TMT85753.1 PEGA domain-containing protein [Haloterrigena sp. H1]
MRRNAQQHRTETRSIQRSVQILLTVCGIVFLLAGMVLAASGASVSSAVGSVSDRIDDARQPTDSGGDTADSDSIGDGGGTDTDGAGGTSNETKETDGTDSTDTQTGGTDNTDDSTDSQADGSDDTDSQTDGSDNTDTQTDGSDNTDTENGGDETNTDESHVLTAVIESQTGTPIDNATVTVDPGSGSNVSKSVDGTGEAEFVLEDGEYAVTANADGYNPAETTVQVDGANKTITLTLEQQTQADSDTDDSGGKHTLAVTVKDENGTAVENATVEVAEVILLGSSKVKGKAVDDDGVATFELEDGEYTVSADADGYTFTEQTVTIDGGDESITLTLASKDG